MKQLPHWFGWSLAGHLLLAGILIISINITPPAEKTTLISNVRIYNSVPASTVPQSINPGKKREHTLITSHPTSFPHSQAQPPPHTGSLSERGTPVHDRILALLHKAIAAHQAYPDDASDRGESGHVKIGFVLHPDGHLDQLSILQSSGYSSLDQAALQAVRGASPISIPDRQLSKSDYFSIDIIFK